jgi:tRNA(Ile)-lysidine synthase
MRWSSSVTHASTSSASSPRSRLELPRVAHDPTTFEAIILAACGALITQLGGVTRIVVALSGGRDSTVLLHALASRRAELGVPLSALHVDHALQAASATWAAHCARACAALEVPLHTDKLTASPPTGASVEAWAREARYALFTHRLVAGDLLLTAHHEDDQAETFLLNALRGSGPAGLRGIAVLRPLGEGWLGRPMLSLPASGIANYAAQRALSWIEDPMNAAVNLERAFLRQRVLPVLREHWPAAGRTLARSAALQRAAVGASEALADRILDAAPSPQVTTLALATLTDLTTDLQASVLRRWIARAGFPVPDAVHVERILTCVIAARDDRMPEVSWKRVSVRRYAGTLYLLRAPAAVATAVQRIWHPPSALRLPGGVLTAVATYGDGLRADVAKAGLEVRLRRGGERCRLAGRTHHTSLKQLLQAYRVPPWQRPLLPLLYVEDELAAVADLLICAEFVATRDQPSWRLRWSQSTESA